jgi:hypothetical protein
MPEHGRGGRDRASGATDRRAPAPPAPVHPMLDLQRQAGNRAVTAMVARAGTIPVQRAPSGGGTAAPPQPDLATVVKQVVDGLPASLDERSLVGGGELQEGRQQARDAQEQVSDLHAEEVEPGHEGGGGDVVDLDATRAQVREMQEAGSVAVEQPAPPSRWQRFKSWAGGGLSAAGSAVGGALSGAWGGLKRRFGTREGRRDTGGLVQGSGGTAAGLTAKVSDGLATGSVTAPLSAPTLEHTHDWAGSFQSGASEVIHQVTAVAGVFFSALKAAVDARALVSSYRVVKSLKEARRLAMLYTGGQSEVVEAVDYAIRQKYQKIIKRAIGTLTALAALGAGLAILIANPVGAGLAAGIIAAVGAGVTVYKLGRFIYKKVRDTQGKERARRAEQLFDALADPDPRVSTAAKTAVWALKLDPGKVLAAGREEGVGLLMRKLKSA